jgi:hypothetical protein
MNAKITKQSMGELFSRRTFLKYTTGSMSLMYAASFSFGANAKGTKTPTYPIRANVTTTLDEMISFPKTLTGLAKQQLPKVEQYAQFGYGEWTKGSPLPLMDRLELMPKSTAPQFFYFL